MLRDDKETSGFIMSKKSDETYTTSVSVIMPCYNAAAYLRDAIESVQNQTYEDWELLIIDDGSIDDSCKIAQEYVNADKRIQLIKQPNSGACFARNNGLEHAKGQYVKFLDADDVLDTQCLARQIEQINALAQNQIPFGDYGRIDQQGKRISDFVFSPELLDWLHQDRVSFMFYRWEVLISCPLHRMELLRQAGLFDTRLPRHQESDLHFRLALADVEYVYYPGHTFDYREYNSTTRISTRFNTGKINKEQLNDVYFRKREALLIEKYGYVPERYHYTLSDFWYGNARYAFANKEIDKGKQSLAKAEAYRPLTGKHRFYAICGKIFGYVQIEALLRLRLRLLHKQYK